MRPEPALSVVIPTWNRVDDLARTLDVLRRHAGPPFEVIVVDNASTDQTVDRVQRCYPEVRLLCLPCNLGPTGGRNVGVANAKAPYVVLLDSDAEPRSGALEAIYRRLAADPRLGAVNALQLDGATGKPWWWWGAYGYPESEFLDQEFDTAFKLEEGAAGVRRDVYLEVGGFDERFFWAVEGRDLAARIVGAGYAIRYCPEVQFIHRADSNRPASNPVYQMDGRLYYEFRNEFWYTWKYFPTGWAMAKTVHNLGINFVTALREHSVRSYLRGYRDGVRGLGWVLKERQPLPKHLLYQVVSRSSRRWLGRAAQDRGHLEESIL